MKRSIGLVLSLLVTVCLLVSCSTFASLIGLEGLAGFDGQSEKALEKGFEEIDWLEGEELKAAIIELCENGRLTVEYSDRLRGLEFTSMTSPIRVRAFNNRIELRHDWGYAWSKDDGWWNPNALVFECYGEKINERIPSSDVIVTNESYYNEYLKETVYTRNERIDHILSSDAAEFIYKNWTNNDLYIQVVGRRTDYHKVRNADLANLYRLLYDTLFPYNVLSATDMAETAEIIGELGTISTFEAEAILFNISQNEDFSAEDVKTLTNLVKSKIR